MIYLAHQSGAIAACEFEATAERRIRDGFVPCSAALYRAYWWRKDRQAYASMAWAAGQAQPKPIERSVGEPPPGFVKHWV